MKKIIKSILSKLGVRIVKEDYYSNLVNRNIFNTIDCFYSIRSIIQPTENLVCFDIGANIGQTAKKINKYFPNADIYAFEPMHKTFVEMQENLSELKNVRGFNFAFGSEEKEVEVVYQENSEWNSLVKGQNDIPTYEKVLSETVKVKTIDNFLAEQCICCIDFLKTDTEGYEMEVLKGAEKSIASGKIKMIYIEVGFLKTDLQHNYWLDITQLLEQNNYYFAGLYETVYGLNLKITYANALFIYNN